MNPHVLPGNILHSKTWTGENALLGNKWGTGGVRSLKVIALLAQGHHLREDARSVGGDIMETMVSLSRERLKPWPERARVYQPEGRPQIPETDRGFDRYVSAYVLDPLAPDVIEQVLSEATVCSSREASFVL